MLIISKHGTYPRNSEIFVNSFGETLHKWNFEGVNELQDRYEKDIDGANGELITAFIFWSNKTPYAVIRNINTKTQIITLYYENGIVIGQLKYLPSGNMSIAGTEYIKQLSRYKLEIHLS